MKMFYGNIPINSMRVIKHDVSTNDADVIASDLQAGKTCYARGKKITGTGKSFEFAQYGTTHLNFPIVIPNNINVIEFASAEYPLMMAFTMDETKNIDFTSEQTVAKVMIDNEEYIVTLAINNNIMTISCDKNISLDVFFGRDCYV